jgi:hypothetical protein
MRKSDVIKGTLMNFNYYKENTFLEKLLWDLLEKYILSLFIVEVVSEGR